MPIVDPAAGTALLEEHIAGGQCMFAWHHAATSHRVENSKGFSILPGNIAALQRYIGKIRRTTLLNSGRHRPFFVGAYGSFRSTNRSFLAASCGGLRAALGEWCAGVTRQSPSARGGHGWMAASSCRPTQPRRDRCGCRPWPYPRLMPRARQMGSSKRTAWLSASTGTVRNGPRPAPAGPRRLNDSST